MRREEFERMTWGEFQCRHRGFIRGQEESWDRARHIMYYAAIPNLKKHATPEKLAALPKDVSKKSLEKLTKERYKQLKGKWLSAN